MDGMGRKDPDSKGRRWTARVLGGLVVLFLLFDGGGKVLGLEPSVEGTMELGFPESAVTPVGWILLVVTALYAVPRTAVLGAILLTGYLGGAVAVHLRLENPLLSHTLFPVYVGIMAWAALLLSDVRVRELVPWRRDASHWLPPGPPTPEETPSGAILRRTR